MDARASRATSGGEPGIVKCQFPKPAYKEPSTELVKASRLARAKRGLFVAVQPGEDRRKWTSEPRLVTAELPTVTETDAPHLTQNYQTSLGSLRRNDERLTLANDASRRTTENTIRRPRTAKPNKGPVTGTPYPSPREARQDSPRQIKTTEEQETVSAVGQRGNAVENRKRQLNTGSEWENRKRRTRAHSFRSTKDENRLS